MKQNDSTELLGHAFQYIYLKNGPEMETKYINN